MKDNVSSKSLHINSLKLKAYLKIKNFASLQHLCVCQNHQNDTWS